MNMFVGICCIALLLLVAPHEMHANSCNTESFNESLQQKENEFANITYRLNITDDSPYADKFDVNFEVCEEQETTPKCTFLWRKQSNSITYRNWNHGNETICSARRRDTSNNLVTFEIQISQGVRRSVSQLKLTITDKKHALRTLRLICLDVLYLPKVTNLTVDGQEVRGYSFNEGQKVAVVCTFDKGNPPAPVRLLDKHGHELARAAEEGSISFPFAVKCEDDWPVVYCQGPGSENPRSVSLLVRCPPSFVGIVTKTIDPSMSDAVTFRVKAHSLSLEGCLLTSVSVDDKTVKTPNCTLNGEPPDLLLSLHLGKDGSILQGNWMLLLQNEIGSAKTVISIIKSSGEFYLTIIKTKDLNSKTSIPFPITTSLYRHLHY